MTDVNSVTLCGRLTADMGSSQNGFSYTQGGTAIGRFSIAVNRSRKQGDQWVDEVSYFNVTVFGKTAENLKPYLTKGQLVAVQGFLKQDRWTDKDGGSRSSVGIIADHIQLCGGKQEQKFAPAENRIAPQAGGNSGYDGGFPEDIPF
ncbi:single-stranded DNA-binding protein [uncultured Treponema sp.]|jgi:single-strand DNA-binding protein|uniref:single-stranded DNA-binding protein n=1 Tax=uncultured Treponema sp. TaxID=162155 RepID=UPI00280BAB16|nr:single-stranded DNA-binding protein [uncultured Treponema sp.]